MIGTRTPVRLSIGGGGTDLPFYLQRGKNGYLITAAIDRYVYVFVNKKMFGPQIKVSYMKNEIVNDVNEIQNDRVRECLKLLNITSNIEIATISDVPAQTGLGGSSSFTVGLLNALHYLKGEIVSKKQLAEEAFMIENTILGIPVGKQDQYAASYGGIIELKISPKNNVSVSPLDISFETLKLLEEKLLLVYTNVQKDSKEVLVKLKEKMRAEKNKIIYLDKIKEVGKSIKKALEKGKLEKFGKLLHYHWQLKLRYSEEINKKFVYIYQKFLELGARGGKLVGAGGGGFFLLFVDEKQNEFMEKVKRLGMVPIKFRFDHEGTKIILRD